jgi:chemosensory pili system protein ChpA (sensor histidine kinase/response regulator)
VRNVLDGGPLILVVQDIEETRNGLEKLLTRDGYRVDTARAEDDAVVCAQSEPPHLLLVNLGQPAAEVIAVACRIRDRAALSEAVPVVIFCSEAVGESEEVALGDQVYVTRPDNFNQLRGFLSQLLSTPHPHP